MMFPQVCITQNQVFKEFSHFFVAIFSLIFIGHLYQHLFLSSFILNHNSRLSSCKILFFFRLHLQVFNLLGFYPFLFFSLALTFAQTALLGFQPGKLLFFFFFFFFFWPQLLPRLPFWVFSLAGFFFFFWSFIS